MSPFLFIIELFTRVLKIEKKAISITNEDERTVGKDGDAEMNGNWSGIIIT
jgi:hypothetical protein